MKPSERLQSLDALRGFDMLFIMGFASLVVAVCGLWPNAVTDSIASQMGHASWDGFTHHDTIFPLFLFIAGVSFPFSLSKQRSLGLSTGTLYAGYPHFHFYANPAFAANFLAACRKEKHRHA